jgi:hypothetical protein
VPSTELEKKVSLAKTTIYVKDLGARANEAIKRCTTTNYKTIELHAGKDFIYVRIVKLVDDYNLNKRKIASKSSNKKKLAKFLAAIHKKLISQHADWKQGITDDVNNKFAKSKGVAPKERMKEESKHFFFRFPDEARARFGTTKYDVVQEFLGIPYYSQTLKKVKYFMHATFWSCSEECNFNEG